MCAHVCGHTHTHTNRSLSPPPTLSLQTHKHIRPMATHNKKDPKSGSTQPTHMPTCCCPHACPVAAHTHARLLAAVHTHAHLLLMYTLTCCPHACSPVAAHTHAQLLPTRMPTCCLHACPVTAHTHARLLLPTRMPIGCCPHACALAKQWLSLLCRLGKTAISPTHENFIH